MFIINFDRTFCKQTVETLIRCRILQRLIWVWTICLRPTKRTPGLYGLSGHLKIDKTKVLTENDSLMKVESIADAPLGAFCNTYDRH